MIRKTQKSHSAAESPRKRVIEYQSKIKGQRSKGTNGVKSRSETEGPRTRSTSVPGQKYISAQAENTFSLPPPFYCIQGLSVLDDTHLHRYTSLLSVQIEMLINLIRKKNP